MPYFADGARAAGAEYAAGHGQPRMPPAGHVDPRVVDYWARMAIAEEIVRFAGIIANALAAGRAKYDHVLVFTREIEKRAFLRRSYETISTVVARGWAPVAAVRRPAGEEVGPLFLVDGLLLLETGRLLVFSSGQVGGGNAYDPVPREVRVCLEPQFQDDIQTTMLELESPADVERAQAEGAFSLVATYQGVRYPILPDLMSLRQAMVGLAGRFQLGGELFG